jgi:hypothetical protein
MTYKGAPLDKVRQRRGAYVAAVLTIMLAWRRAGSLVLRRIALSLTVAHGRTIAGIR